MSMIVIEAKLLLMLKYRRRHEALFNGNDRDDRFIRVEADEAYANELWHVMLAMIREI